MLEWALYLALKVGSLTLFISGSKFEFWLISMAWNKRKKKACKTALYGKIKDVGEWLLGAHTEMIL